MSCWYNWEEWKTVQVNVIDTFQQPNKEKIERTIEMLKVWQSRQIVPVQIEATIGVLQSIYSHVMTPDLFPSIAGFMIIRFINGIVDAPQKMGGYHKSAYQMALEHNIPTVLVELRHSLTHGVVPNSTELISAVKMISEYLVVNYWQLGGVETNKLWLQLFMEIIKTHNRNEIERCIKDGLKHITSSSLLEIAPLIVQHAQIEGEYAMEWKEMITRICGRNGFNDVFLVGIVREYCRRIKDVTGYIENWICFCISELQCGVNDIIFLLKDEGLLFEAKTQQLLKKISQITVGNVKKIIDGFIIMEHLKFKEVEREEMEMIIESQIQQNEYDVGNWRKVSERPHCSVANENLVIDMNVELITLN